MGRQHIGKPQGPGSDPAQDPRLGCMCGYEIGIDPLQDRSELEKGTEIVDGPEWPGQMSKGAVRRSVVLKIPGERALSPGDDEHFVPPVVELDGEVPDVDLCASDVFELRDDEGDPDRPLVSRARNGGL